MAIKNSPSSNTYYTHENPVGGKKMNKEILMEILNVLVSVINTLNRED